MFKFDLQLFSTVINATTSDDEGNNLSFEMKTHYDMTLIDTAGPELVHQQFGQKRPIPAGKGKKIEFRKFSSLPKITSTLTEGVTPDGQAIDVTHVEATVNQYGGFVLLTDVLDLTAIDNTIVETTKLIGKQAGLSLDTVVRNVLVGGSNVSFARRYDSTESAWVDVTQRSDLDETAILTVDTIERAVAKLRAANAPKINGDYIAIIHPNVAYDIRKDERWIDAHQYAHPEEIYNGEIGKICGVRFVESTEAKVLNAGSSESPLWVYLCLFIADGAYGVTEITGGGLQTIVKQKGSAGTADPLDQRSTIGWKALLTAEILVPEYLLRVECCGTINPTAAN